jgi:hypothetical protein
MAPTAEQLQDLNFSKRPISAQIVQAYVLVKPTCHRSNPEQTFYPTILKIS